MLIGIRVRVATQNENKGRCKVNSLAGLDESVDKRSKKPLNISTLESKLAVLTTRLRRRYASEVLCTVDVPRDRYHISLNFSTWRGRNDCYL